MPRFFNKFADVTKLKSHLKNAGLGIETLVDLPTHSHYLGSLLFKQAAAKPGLSKIAQDELLAIADAVTTPKYLDLCYNPNPVKGTDDIGTAIHKEFGHNVEAQLAINWALKQKPYWRLWRKKITTWCKPHYPEIKEEEWA